MASPAVHHLSAQRRLLLLPNIVGQLICWCHTIRQFSRCPAPPPQNHFYLICLSSMLLFKPLFRDLAAFSYRLWSRISVLILLVLISLLSLIITIITITVIINSAFFILIGEGYRFGGYRNLLCFHKEGGSCSTLCVLMPRLHVITILKQKITKFCAVLPMREHPEDHLFLHCLTQ
jgi:hypothetical protein